MEDEIIRKISKHSALAIESLDCYEPGSEQYNHLRSHDFGLPSSQVFHEAFMPDTNLRLPKYDLITMFHVHYYWTTQDLRREITQKVFQHLNPGGVVFILMLEEGQNHQVALRKAAKNRFNFVKERDYQSVTLYGSRVGNQELNPVAEEMNLKAYAPHQYNITIELDMSDLTPNSKTSQLLSYIISVNFDTFPPKMKDFVKEWVREHGLPVTKDTYQLTQSVTSLMYSKDLNLS